MRGLLVGLLLVSSALFAEFERYEVKSGMVEYEIVGSGNVMGIKTNVSGTKNIVFKNHGTLELDKENRVQVIMGQKEVSEDITKFENGVVYSLDNEEKVIYKSEIPMDSDDPLLSKKGDKVLESIGGKKLGNDKIAGYSCDIWEVSGSKMCIYKGVPLRLETTVMGITETFVAKSAKFNISVDNSQFKLPNYPIKTMNDMMQESKKQMSEDMKNMSPEEKKMMEEMMKNLGGMFGK